MSTDSRASKVYTRTGDKGKTSLVGGSRVSKSDLRLDAYGTVDELNCVVGILLHDIHHDFERASEIDPTYDVGQILQPREEFSSSSSSAETKASIKSNSSLNPRANPQLSQFEGTSLNPERFTHDLHEIQSDLFNIGSQLACDDEVFRSQMPNVTEAKIADLEHRMDEFSQKLSPLKNFILPGGSRSAGMAHLARTVCRRAERICVSLTLRLVEKAEERAQDIEVQSNPQSNPQSKGQANPQAEVNAPVKSANSPTPSFEVDPVVIRYLNRLSDYFFVLSRLLNASLKVQEPIWKPAPLQKPKHEPQV